MMKPNTMVTAKCLVDVKNITFEHFHMDWKKCRKKNSGKLFFRCQLFVEYFGKK